MAAVVISPADRSLPCRVPAPVVARPRPIPVPALPGAAAPRRLDSSVYLRRRIAVLLLAALLFGLLALGATRAVEGVAAMRSAPTSGSAADPTGAAATAGGVAGVYVVQPGDTLWSIAERVVPGEDPRPIVDRLAEQAGGSALRPGQRLSLAGVR
jgi:hypothetical protein